VRCGGRLVCCLKPDNLVFNNSKLETRNSKPPVNRPPPYFPQNQLSPPDENRYKKFKYVVGALIFALIAILAGAIVGVYYLVRLLF
jgi:hypothetical protein